MKLADWRMTPAKNILDMQLTSYLWNTETPEERLPDYTQVMFIATFHTHFGARQFHKQQKSIDKTATLMPVPRALSGIRLFEVDNVSELIANHPEDIEEYICEGSSSRFY